MPRITLDLKDLDFFVDRLGEMGEDAEKIVKMGMYEGAKICADELRKAVDNLDRVPDVYLANAVRAAGGSKAGGKSRIGAKIESGRVTTTLPLTVKQKNGLRNGLGIAKFRVQGNKISTVVGFSGYNTLTSKRWPQGQPNQMVAASCESGTSYMTRQPFIRPTFTKHGAAIRSAINDYVIARYREIINK